MGLRVVSQSTQNILTLSEVKNHLRIDTSDEDGLLTALMLTVIMQAQRLTNRTILGATLELSLDAFPDVIYLPRPPATEVTAIEYRDSQGNLQTLDESQYLVDVKSEPARIVPLNSWPGTSSQINSVIVTFTAGYATLPADLKHALLLCCGTYYKSRESTGTEQTNGLMEALLSAYRFHDSRVGGFSL